MVVLGDTAVDLAAMDGVMDGLLRELLETPSDARLVCGDGGSVFSATLVQSALSPRPFSSATTLPNAGGALNAELMSSLVR